MVETGVGSAEGRGSHERADRIATDVDERFGQELFGLARRSGLANDAAEDAVQESLLRLWLEIRSGVEIMDPRAWTFRTLYRLAMDEHRLRRRAEDLAVRLAPRQRLSVDPEMGDQTSIWTLVDRLATRQRQVLYLRYKADMSFDQVGGVLGITASTARAHASFAMGRLREAMGEGWQA